MSGFFAKLKGDGAALPPCPSLKQVSLAWIGAALAIAVVALIASGLDIVLILGSFGASCVLLFGFPDAPFSQPRNVITGHLISSFVGLLFVTLFGPVWWALAFAVATAIAIMMMTRTVHPPAGSNPVIVFLTLPGWDFLLFPTLLGAVMLTGVALIYNNLSRNAKYPKYW